MTTEKAFPTPAEIRHAREAAGLTQAEAAELAGYGAQPRWAEVEDGRKRMDPWRFALFKHQAGVERLPFRKAKAPR